MSVVTGTTRSKKIPRDEEILSLTGGENPVRFLSCNEDLALAMIAGIDDLDRLEAYRLAEQRYIDRPNPRRIHRAIDRRERELKDEPVEPIEELEPIEADEPDADETHEPELKSEPLPGRHLEPGEVLVIDRGAKTKIIWPVRGDEQYLPRAYENEDDSLWMEIDLNEEQFRHRRTDSKADVREAAEVLDERDVEPPRDAILGEEVTA